MWLNLYGSIETDTFCIATDISALTHMHRKIHLDRRSKLFNKMKDWMKIKVFLVCVHFYAVLRLDKQNECVECM